MKSFQNVVILIMLVVVVLVIGRVLIVTAGSMIDKINATVQQQLTRAR